jgi:activator of HSP90 ATPase
VGRLHHRSDLALEPDVRIVQSWRTSEFTADDPDSQIEVVLDPIDAGTKITIRHSDVPDTHRSYQEGGWQAHYFDPMRKHFDAG